MSAKLPARAMLYALLIALLIAIMAGGLVLASFHKRSLQQQALIQEKLIRNAHSGMQLLMGLEETPSRVLDLYEQERDSVLLAKWPWGAFEIGRAVSFHGRDSFAQVALLGVRPYGPHASAIYLADGNTPLALCGQTTIRGKALLPRAGAKRGRIAGQYYQGDQLIYGTTGKSNYNLPALSKERLEALKTMPQRLQANAALQRPLMEQSFHEEAKVIKSDYLRIDNQQLKGHIILIASRAVEFGPRAEVEDILVFAPKITFESGFQGSLQAVATDSLLVEQDCHFAYPSSLGLLRSQRRNEPAFMQLDSLSSVKGLVWLKELVSNRRKARAVIAASVLIEGQLYVDGYLDFKGKVHGNLATRKFSIRTAASVYENHLLNAVIDYTKLHKRYLMPDFWEERGREKGVVKLMY